MAGRGFCYFGKGQVTMSLYDLKKIDFSFEDSRGCLTQLVHEGYDQINVLKTNAGVLRGGHYHKISEEAFYVVSGSVEVELKRSTETEKEKVNFKKGDFFEIHPNTVHSMFFPEDCLMVQMYDKPVEQADGSKDIYPEEI